ncbi:cytidine deaminase [Pseudoalteromonas sp. SCSIO 43201]|uniref:Cytidine deaminase n=1 Tax=Pseudoalteromonas peptidolytica F12-50-A1 TaxID=1315280 RepID=A0A8I0MZ93_9GAMM|nr:MULTISPECIES: cytidine deaminase [Pseudoalteromonas]MBE0348621.1 cytidine deaminase [Pseudoalteromonas peptidolytica F12-50-A1]NLR15757.1 cytidine deaminase [Pseudoalteromonas peptidolytica]USD30755.1 cytidine deaminase [Pseudoalteromonas sp. SCSIO 43201]GEK11276.1 cytidine deaminase [Pseudoalteromonas peptidolytica]
MAKQELSLKNALKQDAIAKRGIFSYDLLTTYKARFQLLESELEAVLLEVAAEFATPPISHFYVGAIAWDDKSGQAFLGANLEFSHQALSLVVHAEQAAINNAWLNGAAEISRMTINAAPCGFCRQFMNELSTAKELDILLPSGKTTLNALLPTSFGPDDLDNQEKLFAQHPHSEAVLGLPATISDKLYQHYLASYCPYTKNRSAVEITLATGERFFGRYAENAAYNPSLSPLQSALSQLAMSGRTLLDADVESITLVEKRGKANQHAVSLAVLSAYDAQNLLRHVEIE